MVTVSSRRQREPQELCTGYVCFPENVCQVINLGLRVHFYCFDYQVQTQTHKKKKLITKLGK